MEKSIISFLAVAVILGAVFIVAQSTIETIKDPALVLNGEISGDSEPEQTNQPNSDDKGTDVCFPEACVNVELADSSEKRSMGLMFRENLGENEGMLFIFENEGTHSFWMKNTLIPLDIIWVNGNMEIVHIEYAVPCITQSCPSYRPAKSAKYVVEVNAGFTNEKGIEIGDIVSIN